MTDEQKRLLARIAELQTMLDELERSKLQSREARQQIKSIRRATTQ
jgi:hypothetical protein